MSETEITTIAGHEHVSDQLLSEPPMERAQERIERAWQEDLQMVQRKAMLHRELRQALAELELCSEVSAVQPGKGSRDTSEDIGGKRPTGVSDDHPSGIRELEDFRVWPLKPVGHYRRRIARARSTSALEAILGDVRLAIERTRRQPPPQDAGHPMPKDSNWKRWVAESSLPASEIARKCGQTRQYIEKVRRQYRERAA